jgi:4-diphosphocytidyl-2-C-methyl-D-erythritol kinase
VSLTLRAPAKINLGLEILGRRPDGYHEIRTILQAISLWDELTFEPADELTLECDRDLGPAEGNLVLRAARLLRDSGAASAGARVRLKKAIPVAAGLGGGSADAAATLIGLNRLWGLGLTTEALARLATALGSDAPYFLRGGAQLATGRGERLESLPAAPHWVVLCLVPSTFADKTRRLYGALSPEDWSSGARVGEIADRLRRGARLDGAPLPSAFERVTRLLIPEAARAFDTLARAGARPALCGAGPMVLSLHPTEAEARAVAARAGALGADVLVVVTIDCGIIEAAGGLESPL